MAAVLPPFTPPAATHAVAREQREVRFRHPAYPASTPDLLALVAADADDGLDFDIALTSCCILTDTNWDTGYLAQKQAGADNLLQRVERPQDGLLRGKEYFFCVEGQEPASFKYPVIPSFHHWRFPHGDLPPLWAQLGLPEFIPSRPTLKGPAVAMDRDITCRVTGYMDAVEKAHLVPTGEWLWFVSNRMDRYCRRPLEVSAINDEKNILVLRKDLHHLFDTRRFTFVPRKCEATTEVVTYVLLPSGSPEFVGLYHNRYPQSIRGISIECLFARFAWSLFTDEHVPFFGSDLEYTVRLWDKAKGEPETQILRGLDARSRAQIFESTRSQSRSVSPKKRSLSAHRGDDGEGADGYSSDNSVSYVDGYEANILDDLVSRGRPRKRTWEISRRADEQVPSLSGSFTSETEFSLASVQVPHPQTPNEDDSTASSLAPASGTTGSGRPAKRIYIEGKQATEG
ncbi:hypothetical protein GGR57DRAFT_150677 [Xylariaceae sp. FL1272]|nr:hypothetical protein GGR57DRAFT_150677 [Xylariaceae sp. FL1272]